MSPKNAFTTILDRLFRWFESRLGLSKTLLPLIKHPVPRNLGWWYVFGSATAALFLLQIITGIALALVYVPSTASAWESLRYLNDQVKLGWMLRAVHYWGAGAMSVMILVHMSRVFLMAAFKYPRELTWLVGVGLLLTTWGEVFTGQVLRWDSDAYWALGIGAAMVGRVPYAGPYLVHLVLGGPMIGAATLSRFFVLHVFVFSGLIIGLLTVHLYLVVWLGISARPSDSKPVDPATYHREYEEKLKKGEPFFPNSGYKDLVASSVVIVIVIILSLIFGPKGPTKPPDPTWIHVEPRPDWQYMAIFALEALAPPYMDWSIMIVFPLVAVAILLLVPLTSPYGERRIPKRPVAVLALVIIAFLFMVLTLYGFLAPWSPHMYAWRSNPIPVDLVKNLSPMELEGASCFQNKQCRNCHALEGSGGERGPDLTDVASRLTYDELIRQVVQGGGLMPAYGKQLSAPEVTALVAFLQTLHPPDKPLATRPAHLTE